jgi:hypothetical protein
MTENIIVSVGPAAAGGYAYINNNVIINPKAENTTYNKMHQITYDYAFNSLYITFDKEKAYIINLNNSIGEILVNKNDKWNLPCINTEKKVIFIKILNAILEKVKYLKHGNIPEEIKKLNQIIHLLN